MTFYFYLNTRPKKVTIHRGECPFCRQGKGIQRKIFKDVLGFWRGPYPDYQVAFAQASIEADTLQVVPVECKHCQHVRDAQAPAVNGQVERIPDVTRTHKPISTYEKNRLLSLNKLEDRHSKEQDALYNLYTRFRLLMRSRHQSEQASADFDSVSLKEQHTREEDELSQDQKLNDQILKEKQAQEKDTLFRKISLSIAGS